jgi:hypothetical protein
MKQRRKKRKNTTPKKREINGNQNEMFHCKSCYTHQFSTWKVYWRQHENWVKSWKSLYFPPFLTNLKTQILKTLIFLTHTTYSAKPHPRGHYWRDLKSNETDVQNVMWGASNWSNGFIVLPLLFFQPQRLQFHHWIWKGREYVMYFLPQETHAILLTFINVISSN